MDILPENSKKEYQNSVTQLLRLKEKRFVKDEIVYKTVLQRAGWALPRPFLYIHLFFQNKKDL
jgi:hypothetical protein